MLGSFLFLLLTCGFSGWTDLPHPTVTVLIDCLQQFCGFEPFLCPPGYLWSDLSPFRPYLLLLVDTKYSYKSIFAEEVLIYSLIFPGNVLYLYYIYISKVHCQRHHVVIMRKNINGRNCRLWARPI